MRTDLKNKELIEQLSHTGMELQTKAETDALTGLYNRSALIERTQMALKKEKTKISALCIMDLDNFKAVNDTYGHQCGDETLVEVADMLKVAFHSTDIVGRLGGDEFMMCLSGFTNQNQVLERIKKLHDRLAAPMCGKRPIPTSIGVAMITDGMVEFDALYKQADDALYEAKRGGKNPINVVNATQNTDG